MTKVCSKCTEAKPIESFCRRVSPSGFVSRRSDCNQCRNKVNVERLHRKFPAMRRINKSGLKAGPSWREANREKINATNKRWRQNNPEKWKAANRLNRHRRRGLGSINSSEWIAKVMMLGNKCQICLKTEPDIQITIDHIVPVSKGGTNHIDNLQPLCSLCNKRKFNKYTPVVDSLVLNMYQ